MPGPACVFPCLFVRPVPEETRLAPAQFRELEANAPRGFGDARLLTRVRVSTLGAGHFLPKQPGHGNHEMPLRDPISSLSWPDRPKTHASPDAEAARIAFDMGETIPWSSGVEDGLKCHVQSMTARRGLLGASHPETASSLARTGDFLSIDTGDEPACLFWASPSRPRRDWESAASVTGRIWSSG
ncbi:MAG: hypothetical protein LBT40_12395 [Deltaproteobacteria bacterium]|nr:hypothetical protein [Deltaproteobacteria bacterium]